ncbi:MAG: hypothetical protein KJN92_03695, partial [Gemmatimonadetes bacterium]|nr:hypothetical protein [Gemmatimonadota bacterium]
MIRSSKRFPRPGLVVLLTLTTLSGCEKGDPPPQGDSSSIQGPIVDSHLHLRTASAAQLLTAPGADEAAVAVDAADALAALDKAGIEKGLVLSVAYLFGDSDLEYADRVIAVRAENDFVANEAAQAPDRLA